MALVLGLPHMQVPIAQPAPQPTSQLVPDAAAGSSAAGGASVNPLTCHPENANFVSGVRPLGKKTSSSTVWKHCRVLKDPNTLSTEAGAFFTAEAEKHGWVLDGKHKHTHVCLECGAGVKLTLNPPGASDPKNSPGQVYNSTQMANHIKKHHENLQHAKAALAGKKRRTDGKAATLSEHAAAKINPMTGMYHTGTKKQWSEAAKVCMAKWLVCRNQHISHSTVHDPHFLEMMCAATGDAEFKSMEVRQLADWVEAEAQRFTNAATVCLGRIVELAGQASIQMLTDAGWFKDRKKYLSMSFQAVEEDWSGNLVIRIDFANFVDGTAEANVDMIKAALDAVGATAAVIGATAQDMAAKKVAVLMDKETAHCGLHQNDKLMKIACGDLDKKKGGKVTNSFCPSCPPSKGHQRLESSFAFVASGKWLCS